MSSLVIGIIMTLIGAVLAVLGLKNKNALLNLINENDKVNSDVKDISAQIATNSITLTEEEAKRGQLKVDNSTPVTQAQILEFFNNQGKK